MQPSTPLASGEEDFGQLQTPKFTNVYNNKEIGGFSVKCGGWLVVPKNWCNSVWAWALIITPSVLQCIFVNSVFEQAVIIDIAYLTLMCLSLGSLCLTTFSDPGIIPREDFNKQRKIVRNLFLAIDEDVEYDHFVMVKGKEV